MAITYVGAGAASIAVDSTSLSPALPAGTAVDDLLLCLTYWHVDDTTTVTTPTGWTEVFKFANSGFTTRLALYRRIATGSGDAPTITYSGSQNVTIAQMAAFRGVDTTTPVDVIGTAFDNGGSHQHNIGPIPGITPTVDNFAVVVCGGKVQNWSGVATLTGDSLTWAEIGEPTTSLGSGGGMVWDYAIKSGSASALSDKTFAVDGTSFINRTVGRMLSLNPGGPTAIPLKHRAAGVFAEKVIKHKASGTFATKEVKVKSGGTF